VNAHEVKPVRLIQSLCAVCCSNLAGLTLGLLYIVLPCVADVSIVNCAVSQQFNKRTLLLLLESIVSPRTEQGRFLGVHWPLDASYADKIVWRRHTAMSVIEPVQSQVDSGLVWLSV